MSFTLLLFCGWAVLGLLCFGGWTISSLTTSMQSLINTTTMNHNIKLDHNFRTKNKCNICLSFSLANKNICHLSCFYRSAKFCNENNFYCSSIKFISKRLYFQTIIFNLSNKNFQNWYSQLPCLVMFSLNRKTGKMDWIDVQACGNTIQ